MANSKYLELVDFEQAEQLREQAADVLAVPRQSFPGLSECVTTGHRQGYYGDGFEALRWAGDPPVFCAGTMPETEIVALPWQCEYCGSANPGEALYCGQCGPSHCGAPKPGCEESPKGALQLREFGSFYVVEEPSRPVDFYPEPTMYIVQESSSLPRGSIYAIDDDDPMFHPDKSFFEELSRRVLAVFRKAIKCVS